jgi:hypothetical protein
MAGVSSALSAIPPARRRRFAATLGLFAMLFVAVGVVAFSGSPTAVVRIFAVVALVAAGLNGLIAWGLLHSVRIDARPARAAQAAGCGCGHDHDVSEMHVAGSCAHDGAGLDCGHDCDACALAALRPSPTASRSERLGS